MQDKVSDEPLIAEQPKAGTIVKTEEGPFGSTVLTLSNGVRVILKTTDFKADEIRMPRNSVPVVTPCSPTMKFFR